MNAKELRIGNYILINNIAIPVGYGAITDCYQKEKGISNTYLNTLSFAPIPLNEDLVINALGFLKGEKDNEQWYLHEESGNWLSETDGGAWSYWCVKWASSVDIQWLHDLQNVWYYHNGKQELEISL